MDPIESFIVSNRKFSISLLMNSHIRLSMLQMNKGGLTFDDILQSLYAQGQTMNTIELNSHSMLILGILVPALTTKGQIKLQMPREIIGNDSSFIKSILNLVYAKCGEVEYPFVEEFKMDAILFLKNKLNQSRFNQPASNDPMMRQDYNHSAEGEGSMNTNMYSQMQPMMMGSHGPNSRRMSAVNKTYNALVADSDLPDDHKPSASRIEFEKSEPIVRLLAQVRKVGMDILFPQSTHDKILACIFVAIRSSSTPAHRELIDMVMAVKESNKITQLDHVSKTKVRGVLALLKHGELLITQGAEGEPVRLYLAQGINTFRDLRERHDVFLGRYMLEHHLFIPAILKSELAWQFEEETKARRLDTLNKLVAQLHYFYKSYIAYQAQLAAEAEENGIPIIRATSSEDVGGADRAGGLANPSNASRSNSITGVPGNGNLGYSGSDMGSTARESNSCASQRSSYRSEGAGSSLSSISKEDWNYSRPQSLPASSGANRDISVEQRPRSTAGFTSHQHTKIHQQQQQFQPQFHHGALAHGSYSGPQLQEQLPSSAHHNASNTYNIWGGGGGGGDLEQQHVMQQQGDNGEVFHGEAMRRALPHSSRLQPSAATMHPGHFPSGPAAAGLPKGGVSNLYNGGQNDAHITAASGRSLQQHYVGGGEDFFAQPPQHSAAASLWSGQNHFNHQQSQQPQYRGLQQQQQQLRNDSISRIGSSDVQHQGHGGGGSRRSSTSSQQQQQQHDYFNNSVDTFDDHRAANANSAGRLLGLHAAGLSSSSRDVYDFDRNPGASTAELAARFGGASAKSPSTFAETQRGQPPAAPAAVGVSLDWDDFGSSLSLSAAAQSRGLGNLATTPNSRGSVRVNSSQLLAAAMDAERALLGSAASPPHQG